MNIKRKRFTINLMMKKISQYGFSSIEFILILASFIVISAIGFAIYNNNARNAVQKIPSSNTKESKKESNKPEVKIKHLGVNLGIFDPATTKAGDFVFTKTKFDSGIQQIFMNYGNIVPASSAGAEKANPQPTFILPLGTKVHSLIDGVVYDIPKLYSNDFSVMVKGEGSDLIFETEHVINVLVKKGDKVKAGDVIAEVSDYSKNGYAGYGLFEIGILKGGNPPNHICPFDYLDESIKEETLKNITALQKAWEEFRGDSSIYEESKIKVPGCETLDPIAG